MIYRSASSFNVCWDLRLLKYLHIKLMCWARLLIRKLLWLLLRHSLIINYLILRGLLQLDSASLVVYHPSSVSARIWLLLNPASSIILLCTLSSATTLTKLLIFVLLIIVITYVLLRIILLLVVILLILISGRILLSIVIPRMIFIVVWSTWLLLMMLITIASRLKTLDLPLCTLTFTASLKALDYLRVVLRGLGSKLLLCTRIRWLMRRSSILLRCWRTLLSIALRHYINFNI